MAGRAGGNAPRSARAAVLAALLALGPSAAEARAVPAHAGLDSSRALPFLPADEPGQPFTASRLTKTYNRDVMQFVSPVRRSPPTEVAGLDALPPIAPAPPDTALADSSDIRLTRAEQGRRPTELTPDEKTALDPPKPGAQVGIPGPVAATTALLGGFALLVKLISELVR